MALHMMWLCLWRCEPHPAAAARGVCILIRASSCRGALARRAVDVGDSNWLPEGVRAVWALALRWRSMAVGRAYRQRRPQAGPSDEWGILLGVMCPRWTCGSTLLTGSCVLRFHSLLGERGRACRREKRDVSRHAATWCDRALAVHRVFLADAVPSGRPLGARRALGVALPNFLARRPAVALSEPSRH
ncbi:hypothetical protein ERJ75_001531000 [Trypanosoma vivax]|nr:hypothetical protein ERJ75_001531000 [Trypanosoma vivax]